MKKLRKKVEKQQTVVKEQMTDYQKIDDEMISEKKDFEMREDENKIAYDEFVTKLRLLERKLDDYHYLTDFKDTENEMELKKEQDNLERLEKIKMALLDAAHQNEFLHNKINTAEKRLIDLERKQIQLTLKEKLEIFKSTKKSKI